MLPELLFGFVRFMLDAALGALSNVIPAGTISDAVEGLSSLDTILSFTPVTAVFGLMFLWFLIDTALNWAAFVFECYRLLPAKFT